VTTLAYVAGAGTGRPGVPIVARSPLPAFDQATFETADPTVPKSWHPVYTTLREKPPGPSVAWWRGDAWGVTIPDLPFVPGGATGPAQARVLSWFLDRYVRAGVDEDVILRAHLERRYTHFSLSPDDSFAQGMTPAEYVAMAVRVRQAGFAVHHLLRSKLYTPEDSAPEPKAHLIDALLEADAMQVETPAWEGNYNSPDGLRRIIDFDAALIGTRCRILLHFYPHYISWQRDGDHPAEFWKANHGKVDGILYQHVPTWTAGMMAARLTDALDRLAPGGLWGLGDSGRGHPIDVTSWECTATQQFENEPDGNGRPGDEDHGNLKGYQNLCAPGRMTVQGFGNGARYPDGKAL
jgi:hypothetical protein